MRKIIPVIVKWEAGELDGNPVLFFPADSANRGMMVSYAHKGQHSEASMAYYWRCKSLKGRVFGGAEKSERALDLLKEYEGMLDYKSEELKPVKRDKAFYRKQRYEWLDRPAVKAARINKTVVAKTMDKLVSETVAAMREDGANGKRAKADLKHYITMHGKMAAMLEEVAETLEELNDSYYNPKHHAQRIRALLREASRELGKEE